MGAPELQNNLTTASPQVETADPVGGETMSPPDFSLSASPVNTTDVAQLQTEDTDPGEAVTDAGSYYVSKGDATIRKNDDPTKFTSSEIPIGTKVKRVRRLNGDAIAQVEVVQAAPGSTTAVGTKYWTTFTNVASATVVSEAGAFVSFSDTYIYGSPFGAIQTTGEGDAATQQTMAAGLEQTYTVVERCGSFARLEQGGVNKGWVKANALGNQAARDRGQYLTDLRTWLDARYTEVTALEGDAKKTRIKGLLSLVESICHDMESGTFQEISGLSTSPAYAAHTYTSFTPSEITASVRRFIVALEAGEAADDAIDWNARLGVPQYRTQSDNLAPPEATCGPTSFTMGAERLGYGREATLQAIDDKLRESLAEDATQEQVETKFEEKAEDFFESFTGSAYQRLRAGNASNRGGLIGEEGDLAKGFRSWGQLEDLNYFLGYLNGFARGTVANGDSQDMLDALHDGSTEAETEDGTNSTLMSFSSSKKLTVDDRRTIQETLNAGGAAIVSLYHKGAAGGTHITTIREVTSEGLAMDDPYGQIRPTYRQGVAGDAFNDPGYTAASSRSQFDWKNVPHYDSTEDDYTKRDFTESAAEELEADESRGQNEVLTWAMLEESTRLLNYIRLYARRD